MSESPTPETTHQPTVLTTPHDPEHFAEAPGSGAAALLAFLHIVLVGIIGYGIYFVLFHAQPSLLLSPNLVWQFMVPVCLGLTLYFPTDPLTKTLAIAGRIAGFAGLLALLVALGIALSLRAPSLPAEDLPTGWLPSLVVFLGHLGAAWLSAVCFGEAIRCHLLGYTSQPLGEYLGGVRSPINLGVLIVAATFHLVWDVVPDRHPALLGLTLAGLVGCRLAAYASVRRASRRPGAEASIYSPLMALSGASIIAMTQQTLIGAPILMATLVAFGLWSIIPFIAGCKLQKPMVATDQA